jgi:predicted alpha/beta superfamily hydrolase
MYQKALILMAFLSLTPYAALVHAGDTPGQPSPLIIGETFEIRSVILNETRRINVYAPPGATPGQILPVLYMPDGGINEDFLHIAGLIEVSVGNNTMRPWLLVGIENTERRRDLTGATSNADDRKIATHVGGSQCFRDFIRKELMPQIRAQYKTSEETGIVGESLAGLFVVESLVVEPDLFDRYIAVDPSLWWNRRQLVAEARSRLPGNELDGKSLFVASSVDADVTDFVQLLDSQHAAGGARGLYFRYLPLHEETHATVYHPAALAAFRAILAQPPKASGRKSPPVVSPSSSVRLVNGVCEPVSPGTL